MTTSPDQPKINIRTLHNIQMAESEDVKSEDVKNEDAKSEEVKIDELKSVEDSSINEMLAQIDRIQLQRAADREKRYDKLQVHIDRLREENVGNVSNITQLSDTICKIDGDCDLNCDSDEELTDIEIKARPLSVLQDQSIGVEQRLKAVEYCIEDTKIDLTEAVYNLLSLYDYAATSSLEKILMAIATRSSIFDNVKFRIAESIWNYSNDRSQAGDIYKTLVDTSLNSIQRYAMIIHLLLSEKYLKLGKQRLHEFLNSNDIECDVRYRSLFNLIKKEVPTEIVSQALHQFAGREKNDVYYRIMACQTFLKITPQSDDKMQVKLRKEVIETLLSIARNPDMPYNRRADAADIAHSESGSQEAIDIIHELGGKDKDLYESKQNAHFVDTTNILKTLSESRTESKYSFESICEELKKLDDRKEVTVSLNRIELDLATISVAKNSTKYHSTDILIMVWNYIQASDAKNELVQRLIQELVDSADTCPSGHSNRLLNVLSGFDGLSIVITWKNQIISNYKGRMMALIRKQPPEKRMEIMTEMMSGTAMNERKNLNAFIIKHSGDVIKELRNEFVLSEGTEKQTGYVTECDFDLYIQDAIMFFEGYHV